MRNKKKSAIDTCIKIVKDLIENIRTKSDLYLPKTEIQKLIHELEKQKAELVLHNKEYKLAKKLAEIAANKYIELYDLAPSGYVTLSASGNIEKINFAGAYMLGNKIMHLTKKRFIQFITNDSKNIFNEFF